MATWAAAAVLLAAAGLQMITAMPHASAVVDEPAHLAAGYLAITQGDLRVNREHPPLVKVLAALPLLAARPVVPPDPPGSARWSEDFEFDFARAFLYKANDADRLLRLARLPVAALTLAAGTALFLWARAMAGAGAALAALALFCFEPNLLAHGRLVTTDMGAALFSLVALAGFERYAASGGGRRAWAAVSGLALGLGLLTRYSCLFVILALAAAASIDPRLGRRRAAGGFLLAAAIALLCVSLGYAAAGQGISLFPLASPPVTEPLRTEPLATLAASPAGRFIPIPLPRLYLEGLDLARHKNREVEGPGYLNGAFSREGWWSYFVQAIAMKSTLPSLALYLAGLGLLAAGARRREGVPAAAWTAAPALILLGLTTALTRAQIGLRYVLPVVPLLCLAGGLGAAAIGARARRFGLAAAAALLVWHAGEAAAIHPYHLAYFNEAAGGPGRGYLHLVDSNLDWGQDLVGVRRFMERRGIPRINLYYFGTADPDYYDIRRAVPPEPGYFAVSATHLMGVYLPDRDYLAPFRAMRPEADVGHSILIYRLDAVPPFLTTPIRRP